MVIAKVGVVGLGLMGSGIAEASIMAGYETTVMEADQPILDEGEAAIGRSLSRAVARERATARERERALTLLKPTTDMGRFADCDLVIEAVTEKVETKLDVFRKLDAVCKADAILASNTSSLSITHLGATAKRAPRVLGTHFFNPVPVMKLVEVIRGIDTADDVVAETKAFCESLGKTVIVAKDTPGFLVNRLLIPYLLDAIREFARAKASAEDIDNGMVLGCNHPVGPLRLSDSIGLDTVFYIAESLFSEYGEVRFMPPPLLKRMVFAGHLGRKSGRGFFDYTEKKD